MGFGPPSPQPSPQRGRGRAPNSRPGRSAAMLTFSALSGVLLDRLLAGWVGPQRCACARGGIAPAGTVGLDGRVAQARGVLAIDDPLDLRAVDPDVLERAVVEPMQLAHRRVALAPADVGAPPVAGHGEDPPGRGAQSAPNNVHKAAQRAGVGGFRAADDPLPPALPLVMRQLIENKCTFIPGAHRPSPLITIVERALRASKHHVK